MRSLKTIVFGLSGNPPTENHLLFIQYLLSLKHYDLVRVVLNAQSPLKVKEPYLAAEARFDLLKVMLEASKVDFHRCILERLEIDRPPPSRMIDTLSALLARAKAQNISEKITLALGLDALMAFKAWYQWEAYAGLCEIKFYPRAHVGVSQDDVLNQLMQLRQAGIQASLITNESGVIPMVQGSATEARLHYASGLPGCPKGITPVVDQLIRKRGYYGLNHVNS